VKRGKAFDKWVKEGSTGPSPVWDKVNGIGRGAARPMKAPSVETAKGASSYMREAMGSGSPPPEGYAPAGEPNEDIPFATSSMGRDVNPIASVLR